MNDVFCLVNCSTVAQRLGLNVTLFFVCCRLRSLTLLIELSEGIVADVVLDSLQFEYVTARDVPIQLTLVIRIPGDGLALLCGKFKFLLYLL